MVVLFAVVAAAVTVASIAWRTPSTPHALSTHTLFNVQAVSAVAQGDGGAWLTDDVSHDLVRFDPAGGLSGGSVHLAGRPSAMILDGRDIWVADMLSNTVEEFAASNLRAVRSVAVPNAPVSMVAFGGKIWVASLIASEVSAVDSRTGGLGRGIAVPGGAVRITQGFGALWVTGTDNLLTEIRPGVAGSAPRLRTVQVGNGPIGVATGMGSVWVADAVGGTVAQVDPTSLAVLHRYRVGSDPLTVAVAGGRVWVGDGTAHKLRTVFPSPGLGPRDLGGSPRALLPVGEGVWVAIANPGRVIAAGVG